MTFERVEVRGVRIDDFLFCGAGHVTGLGRFRQRGYQVEKYHLTHSMIQSFSLLR